MTQGALAELVGRRTAIAAARAALGGLTDLLDAVAEAELPTWLAELDALTAAAAAARLALVERAVTTRTVEKSQAGSVTAWVRQHAPSLASLGAAQVAKTVEVCRSPELAALRRAVLDGRVQPGAALAIATEFERLRPQLHEAARPTVLDAMVDLGGTHGPRAVRELRQRLVAAYGRAGQLRQDEELAAAHVSLSHPVMDGDLATYSLVLDPEGRAILEAAIGPYARPRPADDGSPDPREPRRRRGEALVAVCRRASSAGSAPGAGLKTCVYVTMSYADLTARLAGVLPGDDHAGNDHEANDHGGNHRGGNHCGGNHRGGNHREGKESVERAAGFGVTLGSVDRGSILAPETVRKLACEAGIIPALLGGRGELLELGDTVRTFTPAQLKALWLRDRHCTFPGCDAPAHWCDAHHIRHWADFGRTDLSNGTLLCARHHTVVHRDRLTAVVRPDGVEWDASPGSYDTGRAGPVAVRLVDERDPSGSWPPPGTSATPLSDSWRDEEGGPAPPTLPSPPYLDTG